MLKPLQILKNFTERGARNSANDAATIQSMHDSSVALGAECKVSEAADFSNSDVMSILNKALRTQFKGTYNYPYINDLYDDYVVFSADYDSNGGFFKCDYSVDANGSVSLGIPASVVRKVTYIEPGASTTESADIESDCVQLVENGDNSELREAKTRMLKLITEGWGSSGYYPADVLKRDGPKVFKAGTHNYIDHLTLDEEKRKPEGYVNRLASVLTEDAQWYDDYKGHGPGLYARAKIRDDFAAFLETFGDNIGMSIRATGKLKEGEAENKRGKIIEAITGAKSVDYVTIPGAGGKVLELFESARNGAQVETQVIGDDTMAVDETAFNELKTLVESLATQNARLSESITMRDARDHATRKLADPSIKLHQQTKDRILTDVVLATPLTESKAIDFKAFDALIEAAVAKEVQYLSSVGVFGTIRGFGDTKPASETPVDTAKEFASFQESLSALD